MLGSVNTFMSRQYSRHFATHIFKFIFSYENCSTSHSQRFVPNGPINNGTNQMMAWHQTDHYPPFETITALFIDANIRHSVSTFKITKYALIHSISVYMYHILSIYRNVSLPSEFALQTIISHFNALPFLR